MTRQERKMLVKALEPIPMIQTEATLPSPVHHSEPVRGLEVHDGFKCNDCEYLSISEPMVRRHTRNSHERTKTTLDLDMDVEQRYIKVKVQQWVASPGKGGRYWMVQSSTDMQAVLNTRETEGGIADSNTEGLTWEERIERSERARLSQQNGDRVRVRS
jgi:hypothetical protein